MEWVEVNFNPNMVVCSECKTIWSKSVVENGMVNFCPTCGRPVWRGEKKDDGSKV